MVRESMKGKFCCQFFYKFEEMYDILKSPWEDIPSQQILSAKNWPRFPERELAF